MSSVFVESFAIAQNFDSSFRGNRKPVPLSGWPELKKAIIFISFANSPFVFSFPRLANRFVQISGNKMTVTEQKQKEKLPEGKYTLVGVDIDATGRRILDEVSDRAAENTCPNEVKKETKPLRGHLSARTCCTFDSNVAISFSFLRLDRPLGGLLTDRRI